MLNHVESGSAAPNHSHALAETPAVIILMSSAVALVAFLMVYLAFFDGRTLL